MLRNDTQCKSKCGYSSILRRANLFPTLPALVIGVMLGARLTGRVDEAKARTLMILLMLAIAVGTFAELFA